MPSAPPSSQELSQTFAVQRLAGADRYETAAAIARQQGDGPEGLALLASGEAFPDALAAGALAAAEQVPLLLTARDALPEATEAALRDLGVTEVVVAGGTAAVTPAVTDRLAALGTRSCERREQPARTPPARSRSLPRPASAGPSTTSIS